MIMMGSDRRPRRVYECIPPPKTMVSALLAAALGCQPQEGDPHLRSIAAVTGYHIHAVDGEIGHVEDFLVDDAGWNIRFITVDTRNWWPGKKVLISPRAVREIDWADRLIHLNVDRQKVKDGPPYDPAATVDGADDEASLTYHSIEIVG